MPAVYWQVWNSAVINAANIAEDGSDLPLERSGCGQVIQRWLLNYGLIGHQSGSMDNWHE